MFENVDGRRTTDAGVTGILIAHLGAFGSGELIIKRLAKALIRLRICAGWSEPLLVAHTTLLEISCRG